MPWASLVYATGLGRENAGVEHVCVCVKVNEMTRALRHVDLNELADAVDQSYQEGIELTNLPTKYSVEDADDNPETE